MNEAEETVLNRKIDEFNARVKANIDKKIFSEESVKERARLINEREKLKYTLMDNVPGITLAEIDLLLLNFSKVNQKIYKQ
ncbi:MAG: hypothetical protein WC755_07935 [Candidatus Woesearchaeota archaeon]|jgi:hypothetical protein